MPAPLDRPAPAPHLLAAAQAALAGMADELRELLQVELERLASARARWRATGAAAELRRAAHDLRGLGATYGAPLTGRIAGSLDHMLAGPHPTPALVEAHVDAIRAVVREGAAAADDPRGEALAAALQDAAERLATPERLQAA